MVTGHSIISKGTFVTETSNAVLQWTNLYKVYASAEVNWSRREFSLEIIDGFIRGNEQLKFVGHQNLTDSLSQLVLEIVPGSQLNTYLRVESHTFFHANHRILILVKKQNKVVGYQYIGLDNEIISEIEYRIPSNIL